MSSKNNTTMRKPLFFNTILFRLSAINVVLLIAFIIVIMIITSAMKKSTVTSKEMSQQVLALSAAEGTFKTDVMSLYDQATGYIQSDAVETKEALSSGINDIRSRIDSDISDINSQLEVIRNEEAINAMTDIEASYGRLNTLIDQAISESDSEDDADKAPDTLFDRAEIQKVAIFHSCKALDNAVSSSAAYTAVTMDSLYAHGLRMASIGLVFTIILIILSFAFSYGSIIKKIQSIAGEVSDIINDIEHNKGDLTRRIRTTTHSELMLIVDGINHFIESLQVIMKDVRDGIAVLTDSSSEVGSQVALASDNISNTSAGLQELSASMETINNTIDSINSEMADVSLAADAISEEAGQRSNLVNDIQADANEIKAEVAQKKNDAAAKVEELSSTLSKSVEDSKAVARINELTNVILDVSAQTNLLALNASIEAARAGEAGKGFAVVAMEISSLAANSRETAGTIREISNSVTDAVQALASNAEEVLAFINTTVIHDYDNFVETGDKYEDSAVAMSEMLSTFNAKADNLREIMRNVSSGIENVTNSIHESTKAINVSASGAGEIVGEIDEISAAMEQNNEVNSRLAETAAKFVKL
ncbi:MAG: methyl-accepting chemotaxis protein [Lachnospiraceae bacterium]|nr:methyl-accepting chemotaxis protein [Lachnospiraceae bacterium]